MPSMVMLNSCFLSYVESSSTGRPGFLEGKLFSFKDMPLDSCK